MLDEDVLISDEGAIDKFYRDRGYLDVRVGHRTDLSPDNKEAKVTFVVAEGPQYTLGTVRVESKDRPGEPLRIFSPEQIAALLAIKTGDLYSRDRLSRSLDILTDTYKSIGYLEVHVEPSELRAGPEPVVDLLLVIAEGQLYKVGNIEIRGNIITKDKVARREIKVHPGRPYDETQIEESKRRLQNTRLFGDVRMTVQKPDPVEPDYRDLLVELKERNTGSINFGVAVGSDSGVFGDFSIVQNNFDIADVPESCGEFVTGRAFRGAGQRFRHELPAGQRAVPVLRRLTEPRLLDTDTSMTISRPLPQPPLHDYDEKRTAAR